MNPEATARLASFLGVLLTMGLLERFAPRRSLTTPRPLRWWANVSIVLLDTLFVRVVFYRMAAVGAALWATEHGWGLLNLLNTPRVLAFFLAVLVLDFAIYLQHKVLHAVPLLWRLHQVHHSDIDIDVTTAVRFHPIEIALSMLIKMVIVVALGAPAESVIAFEILLNATALFNHSNLRLPGSLDLFLRFLLVTPDMHRVHHSVRREEADSNFGFNLSCWDRMFGTYTAQPKDGHEGMAIGLNSYQRPTAQNLLWLLLLPVRRMERFDKDDD
jgi:sterol desaturase/sphingolipid hydroxylase (fatty acid hydroxylase superfamily)